MLVPQPDGPARVVVTDFGLAVRAGDDTSGRHARPTMTGQILGTPDYMAPEQVTVSLGVLPLRLEAALALVELGIRTGRSGSAARLDTLEQEHGRAVSGSSRHRRRPRATVSATNGGEK